MSKEAMKLALDALEYIHEGANNQGPHTGISWRCVSNKAEPAIAALREALAEQPAQQEPVVNPFEDKSVISALSWAAGLIEQAYRECGGHNGADSWLMNYADKQGERIRQADRREWEKVNGRWQVKANPPQRKPWVGLTDEERADCWSSSAQQSAINIEAKLKEKNA